MGDVGGHTSLALDRDGFPHISYYDADNADLKYAKLTHTTTIYPPVGAPQPHAPISDGIFTYAYNANGNLIRKSSGSTTRTFTWDADNRLIRVEENGALAAFAYDYAGQRVKKVAGNDTTVYIGKHYECLNGVCSKYLFANGERIAVRPVGSTEIYYYLPDHLGSTTVFTDRAGSRLQELAYFPYGQMRLSTGSADIHHKFTGQEFDAEIGLYYYGARYYDPALMRFLSPDTIVPDRANPQTLNRYSYVLNNPLKYIDPDGHCAVLAGFSGIDCFSLTLQYHNAVVASAVSSYQQGNYLSAVGRGLFSLGTALNVAAGFLLQGIVQPYNSTFMATSGFIEGNYNKALYGSIETALIFGGARLLNPGAITTNATGALSGITNPVPEDLTFARVLKPEQVAQLQAKGNPLLSTYSGAQDAFITSSEALPSGLTRSQLSSLLAIPEENVGGILRFQLSDPTGLASPINRNIPGFVGGGQTAGGLPEFVIPNQPINNFNFMLEVPSDVLW